MPSTLDPLPGNKQSNTEQEREKREEEGKKEKKESEKVKGTATAGFEPALLSSG